jgi:hypothetical protein
MTAVPASHPWSRVQSTPLDPDGDTIVQTNYRWLRGASVVGNNQTYTATPADAGLEQCDPGLANVCPRRR